MTTLLPPDDDATIPKLPARKGKILQPLHADEIRQKLENDTHLASTSDDVLAELAEKTAALTEKIGGTEAPENRTLVIDEENSEQAITEALELDNRNTSSKSGDSNPAADLIRAKLQSLYKKEPDAGTEAVEAVTTKHRSKHQQFMYELTTSGKSLADIQTEWHNYYVALPDNEKHEVWQEFYSNQAAVSAYARQQSVERSPKPTQKKPAKKRKKRDNFMSAKPSETADTGDIKSQLLNSINAGGKLKPIHHVKSLLFGLGLASVVGLIITFVFFNEVFIAPFVSPSRTVSATPIIGQLDGNVDPDPKIIIPKINLEVPVVYGTPSIEEQVIQDALENGVVHYPTSPVPGEQGNVVIVGHSSNNILNSGRYKFAFVLLKRLDMEDTFFLHKDGVRYTYKVYEKRVVPPTEVSVLGPADRPNTVTLITCDPPGTSINRLVIIAEQISPDPVNNIEARADRPLSTEPPALPSNAPSLWSRFWPF